jgi:hypothetical protein
VCSLIEKTIPNGLIALAFTLVAGIFDKCYEDAHLFPGRGGVLLPATTTNSILVCELRGEGMSRRQPR